MYGSGGETSVLIDALTVHNRIDHPLYNEEAIFVIGYLYKSADTVAEMQGGHSYRMEVENDP